MPALRLTTPPYHKLVTVPLSMADGCRLALGTVAVASLSLVDEVGDLLSFQRALMCFQERWPWVPLILHIPDAPGTDLSYLFQTFAESVDFTYRMAHRDISSECLRTPLTRVGGEQKHAAVRWLVKFGRWPINGKGLLERIALKVNHCVGVAEFSTHLGHHPSTIARQLRDSGLPPLGEIIHLFACLNALLALQQNPALNILGAAFAYGFSSPSSLSDQAARRFGVRPSVARTWLGQEPLLAAYCQQGVRDAEGNVARFADG